MSDTNNQRRSDIRYRHDQGLSNRMTVTIALLTVFYISVMTALILAGMSWYVVIAFGVGAVAIQWVLASRIALASMGAQLISREDAPELYDMVQRLSALAGLPMPQIAYSPSWIPNAFATGRSPEDSLVGVSAGLLDVLSPAELEGVLAHELSHIAHRDVAVMTMSATGSTIAGGLMRISAAIAAVSAMAGMATGGTRRKNEDSGAGLIFAVMAASAVVMVLASVVYAVNVLLVRSLSRYRELAADRAAVQLTGQPTALASALTKIVGVVGEIPREDLRAAGGVSTLAFVPGLRDDHPWRWLLSTHPTLQQRLENIAKAASDLGHP